MSDAGHDLDASSSTQQISKVYECPVCYLMYDRTAHLPKCLRCGHTTCLACLRQLDDESSALRCPCCRKEHSLEDDVEDLPTNFSLLEALDTMCVECHGQHIVETKTKKCAGCVENFVSSSMKKFHESVESFKSKVAKLIQEVQAEEVDAKAINAEADQVWKDVPKVFAKYHKALEKREKRQKDEVRERAKSHIEGQISRLVMRREKLEVIEKKLKNFACDLQKKQPGDITATVKYVEDLQALSNEIAKLIDRCRWWNKVNNSFGTKLHECEDFNHSISNTSIFSSSCGTCKDERVMSIGVSDLSAYYDMWYGSATVAQVLEDGLKEPQDVAVSPVDETLVVVNESRNLTFFTERAKTSYEDQYVHESMIAYELHKVVKNLGEDKSQFYGVAIDKTGNIFVTDQEFNCVRVFDKNVSQVNKIGTKGKGQLEFDFPTGIAIDVAAGHLYICDFNNDRIQVITTDGRFVRSFGNVGSATVPRPCSIAVGQGDSGKVYMVNCHSHLYIYKKNGKFVQSQDLHGRSEYGLALDEMGNLLTAETNPNVILGNTNFQILIKIGAVKESNEPEYNFDEARGIALNKNGNMIVCDYGSGNLKVLVGEVI